MPFAFDLLDEEEKKKQEDAQSADLAAPAFTGGGETFSSMGAGAKSLGAAPQKGTNKQGSGFVSLDKYLNANQGNQFGNQFTGKVQGSVDAGKQALTQGAQDFTNASNQGTVKWNDVEKDAKNLVDTAGDGLSDDDVKKFQGYTSAQYQGPESFLGTASGTKAQGSVSKANQEANAFQTEGGRFALLDQYFGRPKYNLGEKSLDNLLVQTTPGVAAKASSIGNQAKQLACQANLTTQNLDNLATANKAATRDTAKEAKDYVGKALTDFGAGLQSRFDEFDSANKAYNDARRSDLSDDQLDAETMALLGIDSGTQLYDLDLSNYLQDPEAPTLGKFANDQDYARYLALEQLAGETPSLLTAENRSNAGTAQGKVQVDRDTLAKDLEGAKASNAARILDTYRQIASHPLLSTRFEDVKLPFGLLGDAMQYGEYRHNNGWSVEQNIGLLENALHEVQKVYANSGGKTQTAAGQWGDAIIEAINQLRSSDKSKRVASINSSTVSPAARPSPGPR